MFGKPQNSNGSKPAVVRKPAAELAEIQGGGIVHVIVTSLQPLSARLFLNEREIPEMDFDSLSVAIEMPDDETGGEEVVRATLARYLNAVDGERKLQHIELFPCTIEVIALGRRISISCSNAGSLDGLYVNLGIRADGSSAELAGLKALRFLMDGDLIDGQLTWEDGTVDNLLPR